MVTIGDPTIDTFLKIPEAHLAFQVNPERTELCIDYADKIPVDELHRMPAGNCVNAAVAAGRLGLRVAIYGVTGSDAEGRSIRTELDAEGIDTSLLAVDRSRTTNASTALVFRGERTLFVWHQRRSYRLPTLPETEWVYATSVGPPGPAVARLHRALCRQIDQRGTPLDFSPGTHQLRMGSRALAPVLRRSELLLLNREEAGELTASLPLTLKSCCELCTGWGREQSSWQTGSRAHSPMTANGSSRQASWPCLSSTARERATYGATLMAALQLGANLAEAMAWGTVQAAHVVGVFGATPGLLRRRRLQTVVREHSELVAKSSKPLMDRAHDAGALEWQRGGA